MSKNITIGVVLSLLIFGGLTSCAGFDLGDVVRVKTPPGIQQSEGLPSTMTLNEAELQYQAWFQATQLEGNAWKASIERSDEIAGMLGSLTLSGLDSVGPEVLGLPVVGAALPALTTLLGLGLGRWGVRREKEASFNKALKVGSELKGNGHA